MKQYPYAAPVPTLHSQWWPRYQWMRHHLGLRGTRWTHRYDCFWFRDRGDHIMYLLRWSDAR